MEQDREVQVYRAHDPPHVEHRKEYYHLGAAILRETQVSQLLLGNI